MIIRQPTMDEASTKIVVQTEGGVWMGIGNILDG